MNARAQGRAGGRGQRERECQSLRGKREEETVEKKTNMPRRRRAKFRVPRGTMTKGARRGKKKKKKRGLDELNVLGPKPKPGQGVAATIHDLETSRVPSVGSGRLLQRRNRIGEQNLKHGKKSSTPAYVSKKAVEFHRDQAICGLTRFAKTPKKTVNGSDLGGQPYAAERDHGVRRTCLMVPGQGKKGKY